MAVDVPVESVEETVVIEFWEAPAVRDEIESATACASWLDIGGVSESLSVSGVVRASPGLLLLDEEEATERSIVPSPSALSSEHACVLDDALLGTEGSWTDAFADTVVCDKVVTDGEAVKNPCVVGWRIGTMVLFFFCGVKMSSE